MINTKILDEMGAKFSELLSHGPAKDFEKNAKAVFAGIFSRLDLVTREEFEVQREVLTRARERLAQLEARVAELESRKTTS